MTATIDETKEYLQGIEGDQHAGNFGLLPTKREDGAPKGGRYLTEFIDTEVKHSGEASKNPGHPYARFNNEIMEPEDFAGRKVFNGMFYLSPRPVQLEDETDKAFAKRDDQIRNMNARTIGAIDQVLGVGVFASLDGDMESMMEGLAEMLEGTACVAKVGIKAAQRKDDSKAKIVGKIDEDSGTDEEGNEVYLPQNRVVEFAHEDSWIPEDPDQL